MKTLLALALVLIAGTATAQDNETPTAVTTQMTIVCDDADKMSDVLVDQYSEVPYASGTGVMVIGTTALQGEVLIWGNVTSKTFSVTISNQEKMCMLINGQNFGRAGRTEGQKS